MTRRYFKWACPDCSDYPHLAILERADDGSFTCPECGCTTYYPDEDLCYKCDADDLRTAEAYEHLRKVAHLDHAATRFLLEWVADDPIPWAEKYAPYLMQMIDEGEAEEWERDYPGDTVVYDAMFDGAIVISDCPFWY